MAWLLLFLFLLLTISIHASRGGSDLLGQQLQQLFPLFQSTLPAGEATAELVPVLQQMTISIHASRGGSDIVKEWMGVNK